jgi:hypothetical protein
MGQIWELSRRNLLAAASGAAVTAWNAPNLLAQEDKPFRFAFLTDMHVQPELE